MANRSSSLYSGLRTKIRFGLVADVHYADAETLWARYYRQSTAKLNDAIKTFNKAELDFVIEMGDFKDEGRPPDRQETIDFLVEIENVFKGFRGPVYHVLGNHDMDSISKDDFLKNITNHGQAQAENYYSFINNGIKFIVLDANYNEDGSDYDSGNFDWTYCKIPGDQKKWLQDELGRDKLPVMVFTHQLLDSFSGVSENHCIDNAGEIVTALEEHDNVIAVFQGHYHSGHHSFRNGIHYYTMNAMVEGSLPENNSYAVVEVDEDLNITIEGFYNCEDYVMNRP